MNEPPCMLIRMRLRFFLATPPLGRTRMTSTPAMVSFDVSTGYSSRTTGSDFSNIPFTMVRIVATSFGLFGIWIVPFPGIASDRA